jgi:hypothetical protein
MTDRDSIYLNLFNYEKTKLQNFPVNYLNIINF